uniref:Uncharacterized protein n=1 Tax=Timema cristinae TaxID=61476 RepID=A0A7R9CEK8_TIMCR|nr:unnamed protein product [Timema cristinae]
MISVFVNLFQSGVFNVLGDLVVSFRNFKVRINAALALSMPATRQQYGSHFVHVWTALLDGLENSSTMEDFSEYRHHDNLIHQLCQSLSHLATLVRREDLTALHEVLVFRMDVLQQHMAKFSKRNFLKEKTKKQKALAALCQSLSHLATLVRREDLTALHEVLVFRMDVLQQHMAKFSNAPPEKSALLYTAASHCSALLQSAGLNTGEHSSAAMLASVFLLDNTNLIE